MRCENTSSTESRIRISTTYWPSTTPPASGESTIREGDRRLGSCAAERRALVKEVAQVLSRLSFAVDSVGGVDNPEHASARGSRAFAMHDDFALLAIHDVRFLPREVVMVLDVEDDVCAELVGNVLVDERVVRGGVVVHQVHRGPVFLAVGVVAREPREVLEFFRQVFVAGHRALAVVIAHLRTGSARTRVREQREVIARLKAEKELLAHYGMIAFEPDVRGLRSRKF